MNIPATAIWNMRSLLEFANSYFYSSWRSPISSLNSFILFIISSLDSSTLSTFFFLETLECIPSVRCNSYFISSGIPSSSSSSSAAIIGLEKTYCLTTILPFSSIDLVILTFPPMLPPPSPGGPPIIIYYMAICIIIYIAGGGPPPIEILIVYFPSSSSWSPLSASSFKSRLPLILIVS